jgi:predicted Rossmann fold nucleotide-binding protein DprA/Smf involved in DNA uptake
MIDKSNAALAPKLIVAGGRDYDNYGELSYFLALFCHNRYIVPQDLVVISGTARGADSLGALWAREHGAELIEMPADWDQYGKSAGYKRNEQMAEAGTHLMAFWDRKSKGTKHMIDIARNKGLTVLEIYYGIEV